MSDDDISTALDMVGSVCLFYDDHGPTKAQAYAAFSTIRTELTRLQEALKAAVLVATTTRVERDEARGYSERLYVHVQRLEEWRQLLETALEDLLETSSRMDPFVEEDARALLARRPGGSS